MADESDSSSDNRSSIRVDKLTLNNWVQWKSRFTLYLKRHELEDLLSRKWIEDEQNSKQYKKKNNKALDALYGAVSKELHNEILENDTSFLDAWDALASACGQNSVITTCTAYKKVHSMRFQPGTSLTDHITAFKSAYTRLSDITANHMQEFGTVTSFMAAALFLDSLENDTDMAPLVQTCYDIKPFNLKNVTDRILIEAMRRKHRSETQDTVMFATSSNSASKPNKKKSKSSNGPKPKAVAPTLNNSGQSTSSKNKSTTTLSNAKSTSSDAVENRIQKIEQSVSDLTELMKKFASSNMLGMVHDSQQVSTSSRSPFDVDSDRSNFFVATVQQSSKEYFSRFLVFDTGATQSCVINLELLTDVQPLTNHFMNTFSSPVEATHVGTLKIGDYYINPVFHVPNGCANIVSATQLLDHGLKPFFKTDQFLLKGGEKIVATFPRIGKLFMSPISEYICVVNMKVPDEFDWHYGLGHASDKYVDLFCRHNNCSSSMSTKSQDCEICNKGKIHRTAHTRKLPSSSLPFHRLHTDVLQISPPSKLGFRYILVIIDDATRFNRIYMLKSKSESEGKLVSLFEEIKNKIQRVPAYLHSDRGGEFSSTKFIAKLNELGISMERGPANSPQTNGVAERFNGVLLEKMRCMLLQSQVPQSMWHEAASHASTLLNVLPHSSINWVSPTSALTKSNALIEPDRTTMPLIPFGAKVVVHRPDSLKLNPRGVELQFLGFEPFSDATRFYDPVVHRVVISRDYVVPSFKVTSKSVSLTKDLKSLPQIITESESKLPRLVARLPGKFKTSKSSASVTQSVPESSNSSTKSTSSVSSDNDSSDDEDDQDDKDDQDDETDVENEKLPSDTDDDSDVSAETKARWMFRRQQVQNEKSRSIIQTGGTEHPNNVYGSSSDIPNQGRHFKLSEDQVRRLKPSWEWSNQKPAKEIRGDVDPANIVLTKRRLPIPSSSSVFDKQPDVVNLVQEVTMADALNSPKEKPLWIEGMTNEHASQLAHITGDLVPPPKDEKIIGGMWVLCRKLNEANEVIRYKARWVGFGNHQEKDKHYFITYASVGRVETFKLLLSIAVTYKWQVFQFDVETAFLHGEMDADVYMRQVSGFEVKGKENWVWKLNKSLYGMKQAPRMWKNHLTTTLKSLGLTPSIMDDALFFNRDQTLFLHIYVDDGLIVGQDKSKILSFLSELEKTYKIKVKEKPNQHLGYTLEWKTNSVILHHQAYAEKILRAFNMEGANSVRTPLPTNALHQVELESTPFDASIMQKAMGYINYLAIHTRPNIAFATNLLSRYSSKPTQHHWSLAKHLLRYIKGTKNLGIEIKAGGPPRELIGYADADYAMSNPDKKSTTGYAVTFQGNLICWKSKKQTVVAQSTTEAEFIAINVCAKQVRWMKNLLVDMKIPVGVPVIKNDNSGAVIISKELRLSENSKHIEIRYQYLRDIVARNQLNIEDISTNDMIADILTKLLGFVKVSIAVKQLNLVSSN